ncbi:MAG: alpha/beta family hydrolase [Variovorax sp.]
MNATPLTILIEGHDSISGLKQGPTAPAGVYVFAHGAGAGMAHRFMQDVADGLAERGIATLRFNFPFMERGSKRPDLPAVAHAAVRAAVDEAARHYPGVPLFAGGKSFGGRMTSQAQAADPLPGVRGLAFVGFPLHTPDRPSASRAEHLARVAVPLLFVQGTRDKLADFSLLQTEITKLGPGSTLLSIAQADHAFHVLRRSGRTDEEVMVQVLDGMAAWMRRIATNGGNDFQPAGRT